MTAVARFRILVALAGVVALRASPAQVVSGAVITDNGGAPVPGAIVLLTSATGARLSGTLTDEQGRFRLTLPAPGTAGLRVDVVGYRSQVVAPFRVDSGATVTRDIRFRFERTALPAVAVTATSRCEPVSGETGDAPRLWAEARKTLEASRLAVLESRFRIALRRYDRTVSLPDSVLRTSRSWTQRAVSSNPFETLPPDVVARAGFSIERDSARYYYAPDAAVLLSDDFVAGHCFGTRRGGPAGTIGLTFRPQQARGRIDIDGTLWLDSASAELRSLEYRYVPAVGRPAVGGGYVAFGRYPSGLWGVQRWAIRLPVLRVLESRRRPDGALGRFVDTLVTAFREEGGELVTGAVASSGARLTGLVFDSTSGLPLAGATITVEGLGVTVTTDSTGTFVADSLEEGDVRVRAWHPRLDSLGLSLPPASVRLRRSGESTASFAVPGIAAIARVRCDAAERGATRIVTGLLHGAGDTVITSADVVLLERRPDADTLVRHDAVTNDVGRYAFCGVTPGADAWITARAGDSWTAPQPARGDAPVLLVPLRHSPVPEPDSAAPVAAILARPVTPRPGIAGWVLGSTALGPSAEVVVDDATQVPIHLDGSFRVAGLAPGTRRVSVRSPGHRAANVLMTVDSGRAVIALITLARAPLVIVQRRPTAVATDAQLVEFRKRRATGGGYYLDRAEIAKKNPRTLTDLLRGVPGVRLIARGAGYTYTTTHFQRLPGAGDDAGNLCDMMIYVDGQPFLIEGGDADTRIPVAEISALEVYAAASSVPRRYAGTTAACGVILVWR